MGTASRIGRIAAAVAIAAGTMVLAPAADAATLGASKLLQKCQGDLGASPVVSTTVSPDGTTRGVQVCQTKDRGDLIFYIAISPNGASIYRRLMPGEGLYPAVSWAVDDGAGSLYFISGGFTPGDSPQTGAKLIKVNERTLASTVVKQFEVGVSPSVVAKDGKWGAVYDNGTNLYEDGPLFGRSAPARITTDNVVDEFPDIVRDGDRVAMVWSRGQKPGRTADTDLWVATRSTSGWSSRLFQKATDGSPLSGSIAVGGGKTLVSWATDSANFTSDNITGVWRTHSYTGVNAKKATPQASVTKTWAAQAWTNENSNKLNQYAYAATGAGTNWGAATKVGYPSAEKGVHILSDGRLIFLFWATQSQEVRYSFGTK